MVINKIADKLSEYYNHILKGDEWNYEQNKLE